MTRADEMMMCYGDLHVCDILYMMYIPLCTSAAATLRLRSVAHESPSLAHTPTCASDPIQVPRAAPVPHHRPPESRRRPSEAHKQADGGPEAGHGDVKVPRPLERQVLNAQVLYAAVTVT
jgi:hypothetical protein